MSMLDQFRTAEIRAIVTETFNSILDEYLEAGWEQAYVYGGFDAWIDYGRVDLKHAGQTLVFEWTNWEEGEISGPPDLIEAIRQKYALPIPKASSQ